MQDFQKLDKVAFNSLLSWLEQRDVAALRTTCRTVRDRISMHIVPDYNLDTYQSILNTFDGYESDVTFLEELSHDRLLLQRSDNVLEVVDQSGECLARCDHLSTLSTTEALSMVELNPQQLLVGLANHLMVWDLKSQKVTCHAEIDQNQTISSLTQHQDRIYCGTMQGTVIQLTLDQLTPLNRVQLEGQIAIIQVEDELTVVSVAKHNNTFEYKIYGMQLDCSETNLLKRFDNHQVYSSCRFHALRANNQRVHTEFFQTESKSALGSRNQVWATDLLQNKKSALGSKELACYHSKVTSSGKVLLWHKNSKNLRVEQQTYPEKKLFI